MLGPGAAEATGPERRKEASGEKTKIPEKKIQTRQAPTSARCPGGEGATGRAGAGCSRAGRMRPSGQGWDTAELGTGGQEGQAVWGSTA